jgi:hypothetical protein
VRSPKETGGPSTARKAKQPRGSGNSERQVGIGPVAGPIRHPGEQRQKLICGRLRESLPENGAVGYAGDGGKNHVAPVGQGLGSRNSNAAPTFARYASEHRRHCPAPRGDDHIGGRKPTSRE